MDEPLLGVILGGLIATVSGAIVPWLQHRLESKEKKLQLQRECKLNLIDAIYKYNFYLDALQAKIMFGQDQELPPNTLPIIRGLIAIDFTSDYLTFQKFDLEASRLVAFFYKKAGERLAQQKIDIAGFNDIYQAYLKEREALLSLVAGRSVPST